jgi:hypothetical protein
MRPAARSILTAAAVLMAALSWDALQPGPRRPALDVVKTTVPPGRPSPPPLARDVLASGVPLSASQRGELQALAMRWEQASAPLETAVRAASEEFDRFAAKTRAEGRTSLAEVQRRSAELRELSAELRARRQAQSDGALAVLTDGQRRQVQTTAGGTR